MKNIFVIGGTTFDHIISLDSFPEPFPQTIHEAPFHEATGSTGAGKALCLSKLDVPNMLYSVIGNDSYGAQIISYLQSKNVSFIFDYDSKGTERHVNIMDSSGGRISMFITQSSEKPAISIDKIITQLEISDVIVLNIISYCKEIIPFLPINQKPIWTDLHDYNDGNEYHEPFIEASEYIFLSSDNLKDYKQTMVNLIERGKKLVVCTHGKNGATAISSKLEWTEEPALTNYRLIDSNGAGDNFFAGFLYAYYLDKSIRDCMRYGAICGAECITSNQLVSNHLSVSLLEESYTTLYK